MIVFVRINKQSEANKQNWQVTCIVVMTLAMASNLFLIMLLLQKGIFGYNFYKLHLTFTPKKLAAITEFSILYLLPCLVLNYVLIFRNKRYEYLLQKYPYKYNGKLFVGYFMFSLGIPVLLLIIGILYFKITN